MVLIASVRSSLVLFRLLDPLMSDSRTVHKGLAFQDHGGGCHFTNISRVSWSMPSFASYSLPMILKQFMFFHRCITGESNRFRTKEAPHPQNRVYVFWPSPGTLSATILSIVLATHDVRETGRNESMSLAGLPFLRRGTMIASLQEKGLIPVLQDSLIIFSNKSIAFGPRAFKKRGAIWSWRTVVEKEVIPASSLRHSKGVSDSCQSSLSMPDVGLAPGSAC